MVYCCIGFLLHCVLTYVSKLLTCDIVSYTTRTSTKLEARKISTIAYSGCRSRLSEQAILACFDGSIHWICNLHESSLFANFHYASPFFWYLLYFVIALEAALPTEKEMQ